ncbi:ABC transporter substrate-binding protein [Frondihabitans cladoniiphilus]|uniref:Solute-binding protein family 5 domain-containing protein n=1 Tax=Frondihabitans cladoniiphilus TaxID=715785 RepID=A0ABP8VZV7_9MICO
MSPRSSLPDVGRRLPRPTRRRVVGIIAVALAGALALSACSSAGTSTSSASSSSSSSSGSSKADITVAVPALAPSLDGVVGGGCLTLECFEMNANLQAGLVRNPYVAGTTKGTVVQDFNKYVPYVAKSWDVSSDGLTYTFHLRPGLKSQVGNVITADDVKWSFERKWNSPLYAKSSWASFAGPDAITVIDKDTAAFKLTSAGFGQTFLGLLANLQGHIYDSTLLKQHATADDPYALNWAKSNSGWGLGPYEVSSQTPDQQMVLTANKNWALGTPKTKQITLRVVADAGTRASLVNTGAVDMAEGITPNDQAKLANSAAVTVPSVANPIEYADLTLVTNKAPFDNEKVRQAMAYATPYGQIISQIYQKRAVKMVGNINPSTKNYSTKGLPTYSYDPKKAKALLAAAGFPNGVSFTLSVSTATSDLIDAAVLVKSYAADAGFNITIDQETATAFSQTRSVASGQAIIYRNRAQVQTPTYATTTFFKPNNDPSNPSRWQDADNTTFQSTIAAAQAQKDPLSVEAGKEWEKAESTLLTSTPEIFIASIQPSQVYAKDVTGYTYRSENAIDFSNISVGG